MARDRHHQGGGKAGPPHGDVPAEPPARAAAYIPPMAAPKETRYHTIDMKAVRLSPDIDSQRMKTQLSLRAIQAATVPRPSRLSAWVALLFVGGALGTCAWWFLRWQRFQSAAPRAVPVVSTSSAVTSVSVSSNVSALNSSAAQPDPERAVRAVAAPPPPTASGVEEGNSVSVASPTAVPSSTTGASAPIQVNGSTSRGVQRSRPVSNKVNDVAPAPAAEVEQRSSSQPKLWLE